MSHRVVFTPLAKEQIATHAYWLETETSPQFANAYVETIIERCQSLGTFPHRGTPRDDIRHGIRTIPFRRRATIAYQVTEDPVVIMGVFFKGQDIALG